ncbi:DUF423 domain-containing protein [Candidatus Endoriftia persephone]|jgi:uncharacterized membrane protein YgdD (TMEM256/DUF423 family)|uniref:UPF0382 membrane protein n=3 Tax=Gammaproteobacteria TaxID=1236 RepID=G2FE32_9GAMM|nr:DUF423 domain-containing protein [Candidatus Endoriftia persephone]EGV50046.1 small membrane protein [endosymbiont of Riftia pachyptila (vent Ph05)]EGW55016.1 UPF0382 membrane protein [endosymbiont of Tevnia jerichonana (vent Tica)]USF87832.1 DUF423 domain-containing protein [Candidatus Endoriftia persephone]
MNAGRMLFIGAISGLLTVVLGAFGAHGLEGAVPATHLEWWQKAVHYQGLHSLALLAGGLLALQLPNNRWIASSGWLFLTGMLLFCGSLYLLTLTGQRSLGMITPIGGSAFIAGWFCLAMAARGINR